MGTRGHLVIYSKCQPGAQTAGGRRLAAAMIAIDFDGDFDTFQRYIARAIELHRLRRGDVEYVLARLTQTIGEILDEGTRRFVAGTPFPPEVRSYITREKACSGVGLQAVPRCYEEQLTDDVLANASGPICDAIDGVDGVFFLDCDSMTLYGKDEKHEF